MMILAACPFPALQGPAGGFHVHRPRSSPGEGPGVQGARRLFAPRRLRRQPAHIQGSRAVRGEHLTWFCNASSAVSGIHATRIAPHAIAMGRYRGGQPVLYIRLETDRRVR